MLTQASQIEKNLYADPDFAKTYEADKKYAQENGEAFVEMRNREVVAMIAYLQRLGTDIKVKNADDSAVIIND
jgi:cytochrome c oxidase cbb3-type subunit I/II